MAKDYIRIIKNLCRKTYAIKKYSTLNKKAGKIDNTIRVKCVCAKECIKLTHKIFYFFFSFVNFLTDDTGLP